MVFRRSLAMLVAVIFAAMTLFAVGETVSPKTADATVLAFKVSSTSERNMRVCNLRSGKGLCTTVDRGHYATKFLVNSARQDAGCEYWESGVRKYKRVTRATYRNYDFEIYSKKTVALRNCRTPRGDVVVQ